MCIGPNENDCTYCANGYYMNDGICGICSNTKYSNNLSRTCNEYLSFTVVFITINN